MKKPLKLSIFLGVFALSIATFIFTSCQKSAVDAANSLDAIVLMQNDAADNNKPAFDSTMCKGHSHNHGGQGGIHNDSLFTHVKLKQADLPAKITAYITANYATSTFKDAVVITEIATKTVKAYLVLLDNNGVKTALRFDGTGTFIEARTGGKSKH